MTLDFRIGRGGLKKPPKIVIYRVKIVGHCKVEKILKGSPGSIPSPLPSVKIQIMSRKVCLSCKGMSLLIKKFVDSNVLPYYLK